MATRKPAAERKGWYHSDLVKVSPARLQFVGAIMESTYGRANFVPFKLDNGEEHTLEMENDAVEAAISRAPRDTWLVVHAAGSRDAATITIDGNGRGVQATPVPQRKQPAFMDDGPEPMAPGEAQVMFNVPPKPRLSVDLWACLEKSAAVVATFKEKHGHEPTEAERSIALSLFIEKNRNGGRDL